MRLWKIKSGKLFSGTVMARNEKTSSAAMIEGRAYFFFKKAAKKSAYS